MRRGDGGGGGKEREVRMTTTLQLCSRRTQLEQKVSTGLRVYEEERERQVADIKQACFLGAHVTG